MIMKIKVLNIFKKYPNIKKIIGFSLVELMISLITISCIAAAFAPVITKKLNKSAVAVKSGNQLLTDCSKFGSGKYCLACYPGECIMCTLTCRADEFLNLESCECKQCASNCVSCTAEGKCDRCMAGNYLNGSKTCTGCTGSQCCPEGTEGGPVDAGKYCNSHYKINN